MSFFPRDRLGQRRDLLEVILVVVVILVAFDMGAFGSIFGTTPTQDQGTGTGTSGIIPLAPDGVCPIGAVVEDTTITFDMKDAYVATTSLLGSIYVAENGNPPINKTTDGGTGTYSPGDKLTIYWNMETPAQYATKTENKVPCLGTETFNADIYRNGTFTAQLYSEDDGLALMAATETTSANSETLSAGDVVSLVGSITGQFERAYPHGFVATVDYNTSSIDDFEMTFDGVKAEKVSTPAHHSKLGSRVDSSKWSTKSFKVPSIISNQKLDWVFTIDADDTIDPGIGSEINITFYEYDYFVADGGNIKLDVLDDQDVDAGGRNPTAHIQVA